MISENDITAIARQFLKNVSRHFDVKGGYLYGSRARNDNHPESDADIAVLLKGPKGDFIDSKLSMDDIAYDTLLETGIRIQPLPIWEEEWEHPQQFPNPYLLKNIAQDGIQL
jgi:predicted nucleotidyltransferase